MSITITNCTQCETPLEKGDLRCSVCGYASPESNASIASEKIQVLRCTSCGAALAYNAKKQAPHCSFCNGVVQLETIADPVEQTEGYLPFTVSSEEARAALKTWLQSLGWFRPSDLISSAQIRELKPLWWVAWVFDAKAMISWAADSNFGNRRSAWAPHSGQCQVNFKQVVTSASRGLSDREAYGVVGGLDLDHVSAEPIGADDAVIEQFDAQRSAARQQISNAVLDQAKEHVQRQEVPGTKFRNLNVSLLVTSLVSRRLSLPAYVMVYQYKERLYRVVICGQNSRLLVGNAPYSVFKIVATVIFFGAIALGVLAAFASG
ncbi:hypothetical protein LOC67_22520 [Stieleria sp. JC731]|uniref:hypothetical protein n=1 Tax=Pirellulaceae TaxID=2691357 RepID=UPI001E5BDC76|nr:hypothetical protein [Stieleria sp. JC731]MCC9603334.1 hypothetical protein [Stieleria sp. JC731]